MLLLCRALAAALSQLFEFFMSEPMELGSIPWITLLLTSAARRMQVQD